MRWRLEEDKPTITEILISIIFSTLLKSSDHFLKNSVDETFQNICCRRGEFLCFYAKTKIN